MKQQGGWRSRAALAVLVALGVAPSAASGEERAAVSGLDSRTAEQFVERAENYVKLRKQALDGIPELEETAAPGEIQAREKAMATAIRARRAGARSGDVFGPARAPIVAAVRADWRKRSAAQRAAVLGEVGRIPAPAVNSVYPAGVPLATFPADLLSALPVLPEQLEYRFAGTHLILLDSEANLVVDVVPDVLESAVSAAGSAGG